MIYTMTGTLIHFVNNITVTIENSYPAYKNTGEQNKNKKVKDSLEITATDIQYFYDENSIRTLVIAITVDYDYYYCYYCYY